MRIVSALELLDANVGLIVCRRCPAKIDVDSTEQRLVVGDVSHGQVFVCVVFRPGESLHGAQIGQAGREPVLDHRSVRARRRVHDVVLLVALGDDSTRGIDFLEVANDLLDDV